MKKRLKQLLQKELRRRAEIRHKYAWRLHARPSQIPPEGEWNIWLILAGRGYGKTRTGAETIREWATSGRAKRICLLGDTIDDVRHVMIEGESGILACHPPHERPEYIISQRKLVWKNGAIAIGYSADAYEQLRGPQFDGAWIDELAKFQYPKEAFDQLMMGLRLGPSPRSIVTTTPKPIKLLKDLIKRADANVTCGNTFENTDNLPKTYIDMIKAQYGGTSIGKQEIEGLIIDENKNALWAHETIKYAENIPELERIVVAIDPAVTCGKNSDETGIVVAGRCADGLIYILDDLSGKMSPSQWINASVDAFKHFEADRIIAEVNNGGELVEQLLHTMYPSIPYKSVRASRGKILRAEPAAALYERGRVLHAKKMPALEEQMTSFSYESKFSPDRLDALVWAISELSCEEATGISFSMI